MIRTGVQYVTPDGALTKAGWDALHGLDSALTRVAALEAKLAAIAAVAAPGGGGTVDSGVRAAVASIIAAAA